jgi:type IV secretory pathway TraG/TraD family ATPase VirD4
MSNVDFSSWPPHQEQAFIVYEEMREQSQRKAWTMGAIAAGAFFFVLILIYVAVEPQKIDMTKDMNMSNITKKASK